MKLTKIEFTLVFDEEVLGYHADDLLSEFAELARKKGYKLAARDNAYLSMEHHACYQGTCSFCDSKRARGSDE